MFKNQNFVILSAEQGNLNFFQNTVNTLELEEALKRSGMKYIKVNGVYNSRNEVSFAVLVDRQGQGEWLKKLARHYSQEAILAVSSKGRAVLVFMGDNSGVELGQFKQVNSVEGLDAYTELVTDQGREFYACV